jgi:hypothetical protein
MQDRFAFTAKPWGNAAVVCRATEDYPGPVVDQEFGIFETWTQAHSFARRLNEGLELDPLEERQIITSSFLCSSDLLRAADFPEAAGYQPRGAGTGNSLRVSFLLAEMDLALTFCRLAHSKPNRQTDRLLRNARSTLFDAIYCAAHFDLADRDLQEIIARIKRVQEELQQNVSNFGRIDVRIRRMKAGCP